MYKALQIMGYLPYQLVSRISSINSSRPYSGTTGDNGCNCGVKVTNKSLGPSFLQDGSPSCGASRYGKATDRLFWFVSLYVFLSISVKIHKLCSGNISYVCIYIYINVQ